MSYDPIPSVITKSPRGDSGRVVLGQSRSSFWALVNSLTAKAFCATTKKWSAYKNPQRFIISCKQAFFAVPGFEKQRGLILKRNYSAKHVGFSFRMFFIRRFLFSFTRNSVIEISDFGWRKCKQRTLTGEKNWPQFAFWKEPTTQMICLALVNGIC